MENNGQDFKRFFSWWLPPYVEDIHKNLKLIEYKTVKLRFRSPQLHHRPWLIDWIRTIAERLQLSNSTVHIGVHLTDTFMDNHTIKENRLGPVCLTCLVIAAKYEEEETRIPKLKELPSLVVSELTVEDFIELEKMVLKSMHWCVSVVTPVHFAEYYSLFSVAHGDSDSFGTAHNHLLDLVQSSIRDFLDVSLTDIYMIEFLCSKVAASCLLASRLQHGIMPVWPTAIENMTGYSVLDLQDCLDVLIEANVKSIKSESKPTESGYESCSPDNIHRKNKLKCVF